MTDDEPDLSDDQFFAKALAFELGIGLVAVLGGWLFGFNPLPGATREYAANVEQWRGDLLVGIIATVPMIAGLIILHRYPFGRFRELKDFTQRLVVPLFRGLSTWQLLLISAAAGFGEETMFRGLIQAGLASRIGGYFGIVVGITIASILFGLCHWLTPTYGVLTVFVSVYLGLLYVATDSLLVPMIVHGLYDFAALMYLVRKPSEEDDEPQEV